MTSKNLKSAIWLVLAVSATALAAGPGSGGGGGGGGSGGKPAVETSNNLSYPIIELTSGGAVGTIGPASTSVAPGAFPTNFAYGCPDTDPLAEYPNKSCVSSTGTFYAKDSTECKAICTDPTKIERMYKQKVPGQIWKSEVDGLRASEFAAYVDWGDALESRTSAATSVVRVETMPFILQSDPLVTMQGFEMWHVFGTGKTEMWGARVTDPIDDAVPQHYNYDTTFAIIHTGNARLNLAKLSNDAVTCPAVPSTYGASPYDGLFDPLSGTPELAPVWNSSSRTWDQALANATFDMVYSAELNIQGKYVYGYNWNLKNFVMPAGITKAGWWRLTFYASDVNFLDETIIGAPAVPASIPALPLAVVAAAGEIEPAAETVGRLYVATARDAPDNLTFIDVCISAAKGGGSRKPPSPGE
jgi:hypothetical protein